MRRLLPLALPSLLLAAASPMAARADATVPAEAAAEPLRCSYEDVGYFRDVQSDRVKRAQALAGPELYFEQASAHHVLFADRSSSRRLGRAVLIDLDTHQKQEIDAGAVAFVEDAAGSVIAIVAFERSNGALYLLDGTGRARWAVASYDRYYGDDLAVAIAGSQLIVAGFHRIATGSNLRSFDLATGRPLWTADVEQVNASHSKYYNDVTVEARGGRIILRGVEAYGCYVQVFDAATGRRLSSRMKR
ncbi:MAG TPA: hypothetical protein VFF06_12365 [Polyangia bacterium]|nr:hypothetical protein [Polyangia bacterium]